MIKKKCVIQLEVNCSPLVITEEFLGSIICFCPNYFYPP